MKLSDLVSVIDRYAPFSTALSFDNAGILCGDPNREIRTVLLSLDITYSVIEEASACGADLILTHHPALFTPQKEFSPDDRVYRLIQRGICAVAAHTNLDMAKGGVNDVLAERIGLQQVRVFEQDEDRIARRGELSAPRLLKEYASCIKSSLNANTLRFADGGRPVRKVALCSGAGGELWELLRGTDLDTLVTGEAKYHHFLEASQAGINLIEAGHFSTENMVLPVLESWIKEADPSVQVLYSTFDDPVLSL